MVYDENGHCTCNEASKVLSQIGTLITDYLEPRLKSGECTQLEAMALIGYFGSAIDFPVMCAIVKQRCRKEIDATE